MLKVCQFSQAKYIRWRFYLEILLAYLAVLVLLRGRVKDFYFRLDAFRRSRHSAKLRTARKQIGRGPHSAGLSLEPSQR